MSRFFKWFLPLIVLLGVCAGVYLCHIPQGVMPGPDSRGLWSLLPGGFELSPLSPLWTLTARTLVSASSSSAAAVLGAMNTLLAVILLGLFAWLMSFVLRMSRAESGRFYNAAVWIAALLAALWLGTSSAFIMAATRPAPVMLHVVMFLLALLLLQRYYLKGGRWLPAGIAFYYGIAAVEYPAMYFYLPLFAAALLVAMYNHRHLRVGNLVLCAVAGTVGAAALYTLAVWRFMSTPGHYLREYGPFHSTLWQFLIEQYQVTIRSLPQVGWILIVVLTVVPLLACVVMLAGIRRRRVGFEHYLLFLIITVVVAGVHLNMPGTPWALLGARRLLLMPYLLSAAAFGFTVFFWITVPFERLNMKKISLGGAGPVVIAGVITLLAVSVVSWGAVKNATLADPRSANLLRAFAEDIVESLDGRTWLVTDGIVDENLMMAARARGIELQTINLRQGRSPVYLKSLQELFDDPTLKNMAGIGIMPLLQVWLQTDNEISDKLALLVMPELWVGNGFTPVPAGAVYFGIRNLDELNTAQIYERNAAFWDKMLERYAHDTEESGDLAVAVLNHIRAHYAVAANNLGVMFEDAGERERAWRSYSAARRFDENNLSAVLNMRGMVEQGYRSELREELDALIESILKQGHVPRDVWQLAGRFGFVRSPEIFVRMGMDWARTGQPGAAVAGIQRALDMIPAERHGGLKNILAGMLFADMQPEKSEHLYREALKQNSDDVDALLGLARIEAMRGDAVSARALVAQAAAIAGDAAALPLAIEQGAVSLLLGKPAEAREALEPVLAAEPQNLRAWTITFVAVLMQQDADGMSSFREDFTRAGFAEHPLAAIAGAYEYSLSGRMSEAAAAFSRLAERMPGSLLVLDPLIRLNLVMGDFPAALQNARRALVTDSRHVLGNYVMGSFQLSQGETALAEDFLRRSLKGGATFMALNDLGWLLAEKGEYAEAEQLARDALEMRPNRYEPMDTLGFILTRTGRYAEAEKLLERALELAPGSADVYLHYAMLLFETGDSAGARDKLEGAVKLQGMLSPAQQARLAELRLRLEGAAD